MSDSSVVNSIELVKPVPLWNSGGKITDLEFLNSIDYKQLDKLNESLIKVATSMDAINNELAKRERWQSRYEITYKKEYRSFITNSNLTSDSAKKLQAEIHCQELEMKILYGKTIMNDLKRRSNTYRTTLDVLQTIGNNVRKEMGL